jgi:hypothetical protein
MLFFFILLSYGTYKWFGLKLIGWMLTSLLLQLKFNLLLLFIKVKHGTHVSYVNYGSSFLLLTKNVMLLVIRSVVIIRGWAIVISVVTAITIGGLQDSHGCGGGVSWYLSLIQQEILKGLVLLEQGWFLFGEDLLLKSHGIFSTRGSGFLIDDIMLIVTVSNVCD